MCLLCWCRRFSAPPPSPSPALAPPLSGRAGAGEGWEGQSCSVGRGDGLWPLRHSPQPELWLPSSQPSTHPLDQAGSPRFQPCHFNAELTPGTVPMCCAAECRGIPAVQQEKVGGDLLHPVCCWDIHCTPVPVPFWQMLCPNHGWQFPC